MEINTKDILSIISSLLSIILATVTVWNISKSIIKRLVIIQHKLEVLKSLLIFSTSRVSDIENFLSVNHGYHIRTNNIQENLIKDYDSNDTGF